MIVLGKSFNLSPISFVDSIRLDAIECPGVKKENHNINFLFFLERIAQNKASSVLLN